MVTLKEMLGLTALPYRWKNLNKCIFEFNDAAFGILVESQLLKLKTREKEIDVANVSFGLLKDIAFKDNDLDLSLTGMGNPRLIFSTVAEACCHNIEITGSDIICLGSSDEHKEKRSLLYSVALSEIRTRIKEFNKAYDIKAHTENGTYLTILSKIQFTDEEKDQIKSELYISK